MAIVRTTETLQAYRCPQHGTYRAYPAESRCPACPPEPAAEPLKVVAPPESTDFPEDEHGEYE